MKPYTVLLTDLIAEESQQRLAKSANVILAPDNRPETLTELAESADAIIVRSPLPPPLFDRARRLRGVVRHGAGYDMIPVDIASSHGVAVANVPAVNATTVAEHALGQMISLSHRLTLADRMLRSEGWQATRAVLPPLKRDVSGRRLGIVGLGQIGQALARMAHHALNMQVSAYRPSMQPVFDDVKMQPLDTLFAESDFIVLACPLNEQTRGLVNARLIAHMQPHAMLVNVARGAVIEEPALIKALQEGKIGGAALDVFTTQPLPADSPLLNLQNVVLSTHMAGMTKESMQRMGDGAVDQVLQLLRGELPAHLLNTEYRAAIEKRLHTLMKSEGPAT